MRVRGTKFRVFCTESASRSPPGLDSDHAKFRIVPHIFLPKIFKNTAECWPFLRGTFGDIVSPLGSFFE